MDLLDAYGGPRCAYVTVAQFAEFFAASVPFAHRLTSTGAVRMVRLGSAKRIAKATIREIVAAGGLD